MGYISPQQAEDSRWMRGGAKPSMLTPEATAAYGEAAARVRAMAEEPERHRDAWHEATMALIAAGWRRAPWPKLGEGSSDWISPDGRRCTRAAALRDVAASGRAPTSATAAPSPSPTPPASVSGPVADGDRTSGRQMVPIDLGEVRRQRLADAQTDPPQDDDGGRLT